MEIIQTLKLRIVRPAYSDEIEKEIKEEKERRRREFIEKNKDKFDKKSLKEMAKKSTKLDQKFWSELKNKHPEIITMQEFSLLMRDLQFKLARIYNEAISEIYIKKIIEKEKVSVRKLLSDLAYKKAYKVISDSSVAIGLTQKLQSNFDKKKLKDLLAHKISLPTKKFDTFSIPLYKQTSGDEYKGFEVSNLNDDFLLNLTLPKFEIKETSDKKNKIIKNIDYLKSNKKLNLKLILSTKTRRKNKKWTLDEGTDALIRKIISFDSNGKSEFQKEWEEYVNKVEKDENLKNKWIENYSKKTRRKRTWEETKKWLRNMYKIGWIEILKGKKIGTKNYWFVNFTINLPPPDDSNLDKQIIGGIDIGWSKPLVCAVNNSLKRLIIDENEVIAFNKKALARRREILRDSRWKRGGHGKRKKYEIIENFTKKNEERRKKIMERWAKEILNFFINNKVGIVQRENLGIKNKKEDSDFFKLQRMFWPYAALQEIIDRKLKEKGIEVKEINPKFTSQICSNPQCRHWNKYFNFKYRTKNKMPLFKCEKCGLKTSGDYNAAKNISTPDIENIIKEITKNDKCHCRYCAP